MLSTPEQYFTASYDKTTKIITVVSTVVLVVPVVATQSIIIAVLCALLFLLAYAYSPRCYRILDRSIVVHRLIGNVRIPLDAIHEARPASADDFCGGIRLWGNGGLFGYYGLFRTTRLGKCWWYVTNRKNAVVVITGAKTALFSPDDVDGFLAAIRAAVPVPTLPTSPPIETWRFRGLGVIGTVLGAAFAVVLIALVVFAVTYSPGPPMYTLTPTSLTIHDRFYPVTVRATVVDVDHIRVVDVGTDTDWRTTGRTNGFSNAHYHSGWFRVANGQKVRMYRADGRRLVLIPARPNGVTLLLEAQEPETFIKEVRKKWYRSE